MTTNLAALSSHTLKILSAGRIITPPQWNLNCLQPVDSGIPRPGEEIKDAIQRTLPKDAHKTTE